MSARDDVHGLRVGILGGGQLGRMLALAGYPLGMRFRVFDPAPDACAGQLAELHAGDYADVAALDRFADGLDVVTYEFENVPVAAVRHLQGRVPVFPPPLALETAQDRLVEKQFFNRIGLPTPRFVAVDGDDRASLDAAVRELGLPAVLKTRREGYDGKGQVVLRAAGDLDAGFAALAGRPLILEAFVPFDFELAMLAARGRDGSVAVYPPVEIVQRAGMLHQAWVPARAGKVSDALAARAREHALAALDALDYVGVLAIEFFVAGGGSELLGNEMAPRVHNSGHWSIEGARTSQFEQHLRAVSGLPLGDTAARGQVALLNLIGTLPAAARVLAIPDAHLHDYGKSPRPGRKLGHVTLLAEDAETLGARMAALAEE